MWLTLLKWRRIVLLHCVNTWATANGGRGVLSVEMTYHARKQEVLSIYTTSHWTIFLAKQNTGDFVSYVAFFWEGGDWS